MTNRQASPRSMDYDNYQMLGDGPVPLFSVGALSPVPFSSSPVAMEVASPYGYDYGSVSPIYGSGYSTPNYGFSPPCGIDAIVSEVGEEEEEVYDVTAHVHPGGQGGAAKPCLSMYLREGIRVDVSANGAVMVSNPKQGVFLALGCYGTQLAVVHPVGRVMQNKGRIEIQTQDWAMKSAKMWQRGISFTTSGHALSYLVDTAGARSTTDTFRDLYSRNIAQDIFDISSQLGRYEDSRLAVERCVHELNAIDHHHYSNTDEWVVSGIIIKQTEDGFVSIERRIKENRFFLKTSPGNGKAKIETKSCYLTASQSINPHLYVRSGESRFHYSGGNGEFVARYGGHSAGFGPNGAFKIF